MPPHSIVFTTFDSTRDRRLLGWSEFRQALFTARQIGNEARALLPPAPHPDCPGATVWRLLAPNNRELGRSWAVYASRDEAVRHIDLLRVQAKGLAVIGLRGSHSSQYGWIAATSGRAVLTTGRWFGAPSTGYQSASAALAALPGAVLVRPGVHSLVRERVVSL